MNFSLHRIVTSIAAIGLLCYFAFYHQGNLSSHAIAPVDSYIVQAASLEQAQNAAISVGGETPTS